MIYFQYFLDWKDYEKEGHMTNRNRMYRFGDSRNAFEEKYCEDHINNINDDFRALFQKDKKYLVYISKVTDRSMELCVAFDIRSVGDSGCEKDIAASFPECVITKRKEITITDFRREVSNSRFYNANKTLTTLNIDYRNPSFFDTYPFDKEEQIYEGTKMTREQCKKRAAKILASKSMSDELTRIYSRKNCRQYYGHPVHYLVSAGEWGAAMDMIDILIGALLSNGRLLSGRQTIIRNVRKGTYRDENYKQILQAAEGGVAVIEINTQDDMGMFATDFHEFTKVTGNILSSQKKDTLFIFVEIMGESMRNEDALNNIITKADIIQITEGSGTFEQAKDYLFDLIGKAEFAVDDMEEAVSYLPKQETYSVTDIYCAYNAWYGSGLKNHIYKAYKDKKTYQVAITPIENKPYEDLQRLVGLKEIKTVVDDIIAAGKVKCARERMGLNIDNSSMHMIFTGTPGTAKTTVARLLAQILKDEDIVKSGKFVECGRQDLVARYVGWTAKTVAEKFKAAQGGVLFIDEAYALVDDGNTFGAEAINTITQLMENYRDQVIVIFAGYPDKMQNFLEQNEGLRSRIAFHLNFPDYSSNELLEIMKLMCEKRQYTVTDEALEKCLGIFEQASGVENFGNGRYVRNVLEQAIMRQSNRLVTSAALSGKVTSLSKDVMCRLEAGDFSLVPLGNKGGSRIGFAI